jgi:DNA replicative helicase MCM subunit Mcm2 (Cdc46/Mcm family)
MNKEIASLWRFYFTKEKFLENDNRIPAIQVFYELFLHNGFENIILNTDFKSNNSIYLNVKSLADMLPFPDFVETLVNRPVELIGTIGIALSLILLFKSKNNNNNTVEPIAVVPRFHNLLPEISFNGIKSGAADKLVSIRGHVIRVNSCRPLIEVASFLCSKCQRETLCFFEDGIFCTPEKCSTPKFFIFIFLFIINYSFN